jgi:outer membrane protein
LHERYRCSWQKIKIKAGQMKNALLIINVLLVIAVGTLFVLYFSKKNPQVGVAFANNDTPVNPQGFKIAYFEMDSIENNYAYFKDVRNKFRAKEEKLNGELQQLKEQYNKLWEESTQMQAKLTDDEKMKRQQTLQMLQERFTNKQSVEVPALQNESFRDRQEVSKKIQEYLKQYNKEKGFAFIFSSNPDLIYYKDSAYNVTNDVINGLNGEYRKKE